METQESLSKMPPLSQSSEVSSESGTISREDIASISAFSRLSDPDMEKVASITSKKRFPKDALVFNKEDSGGQLFFVEQGEVKTFWVIRENQQQTLRMVQSGGFFGIVSFIDGKNHSVSAVCNTDSVIFLIDKTDLDELIREDPVFGVKLIKIFSPVICSCLRSINSEIKKLYGYVTSGT